METLLSNDHFNSNFQRTEIHIVKYDHSYIIRIEPVKLHSAGVYSCEDDVSQKNIFNHMTNITVHVIRKNF